MTTRSRSAYTLVELLVVTTLTMVLLGLVVTGARPSRSNGDIRNGAQQFASILLASQSLSLGSPTGAAVIINSDDDAANMLSTVISQARRYPFIEGTVVSGMPPANPAVLAQAVVLRAQNDDTAALEHGFKIRFLDRVAGGTDGPESDWFEMTCTTAPNAVVRMRQEYGQSPQTAIWPAAAASGTLSFQAARYPIPNGLTQALPKGVAIDLRCSGYGDESLAYWGSLSGTACGDIAIGFDTVGAVDSLMQNVLPDDGSDRTVQPISPNEQVYFFVTLEEEIPLPSLDPNASPPPAREVFATLASDRSLWVVIQPRTGRVTIAPNVKQKAPDEAAWQKMTEAEKQSALRAALRPARAKARQGSMLEG